jgi:prolipoprotein diacylglyceryl transferase
MLIPVMPDIVVPLLSAFSIPSPDESVWHLGPLPLRGYALSIIAGIIAAIWIGERRWVARGGKAGEVSDVAVWAVPFGVVGGRIYHVVTDNHLYFGADGNPVEALYIWRGGLGIWGAIALGAVGMMIGSRLRGIRLLPMLDACAPGVLIAHALGRWGNWFNQELFGKPTDLPWALEIDTDHRPVGYEDFATFHPTYLYEFLWCVVAFFVVVWIDRRLRLGHGRVVALYVMAYTSGRAWNEMLRIDSVQLDDVLGLRLNVWTSIVLFALAAAYFVWAGRKGWGREESVYAGAEERTERAADDNTDTDSSAV